MITGIILEPLRIGTYCMVRVQSGRRATILCRSIKKARGKGREVLTKPLQGLEEQKLGWATGGSVSHVTAVCPPGTRKWLLTLRKLQETSAAVTAAAHPRTADWQGARSPAGLGQHPLMFAKSPRLCCCPASGRNLPRLCFATRASTTHWRTTNDAQSSRGNRTESIQTARKYQAAKCQHTLEKSKRLRICLYAMDLVPRPLVSPARSFGRRMNGGKTLHE